tara:strand:- start:253 stop:609 length:357 start_codon:yes stop_codon:yes gene_type:complete
MIKLIISFLLIGSAFMLVIPDLAIFFQTEGVLFVMAGAFSFALFGKDNSERIHYYSKGAVTFGWLAVFIGAIKLLANLEADSDNIGIAIALSVMLLPALYGYLTKAICFVIKSSGLVK